MNVVCKSIAYGAQIVKKWGEIDLIKH
jgi:hypothetical protein